MFLSAVVTVVLLSAGCGDDGEDSAGKKSPSASPTLTTPSPTTTSPTPTPTKTKKRQNIVAWILGLGPSAPQGPPEFTAYRELQNLRCAKVFDRVDDLDEPAVTLYRGAAQACLAAFEGQRELWPEAAAARSFVGDRREDLNCMDRAAFALLDRLVALHAKHPDRQFRRAPSSKSKAAPCPKITDITPEPASEGEVVRIEGHNLGGNVIDVSLIDSNGKSQSGGSLTPVGGTLELTLPEEPPSDASATVCIVVHAEPDWIADGELFTYNATNSGPPTTFECPPREPE